ncbi:hypothetical protein [Salegentibacter maritimus]|uniref:CarboxypepD_reg-like domain-containing protein n=1 Tax=Salegentibacter maritimus TaxID=2794347 RepID=A0ABS0TG33_9FLAO|nr:hypothetical protein [Salegentibacter maritimus]MBI6120015.1 hypothetical protein [Salegentibacter maritimus]
MIKNAFYIAFILFNCVLFAQDQDRIVINGKIIVPENDSPEGMTIFNQSTSRGTIANSNGEFKLQVALQDTVVFSAIQFKSFKVVVEEGVINSGEMNVFLTENITELPEIRLSNNELSGDIRVDVARIEVEDPDVPQYSAADLEAMNVRRQPDSLMGPGRNDALAASNTRLVNGLNFVNVFKLLVGAEVENNPFTKRELDEKLRDLYDDEFFKANLNIERDRINDFIYYVTDHGLDQELLEDGNELNLIEFLIKKSEEYKAFHARD